MTRYDLIALIPWAIFSAALILICIRLQRSCRRSQHRPARPAEPAQASEVEPADGPDAISPSPGPRQAATSTGPHHREHPPTRPRLPGGRLD
jgi:hypothetical protein